MDAADGFPVFGACEVHTRANDIFKLSAGLLKCVADNFKNVAGLRGYIRFICAYRASARYMDRIPHADGARKADEGFERRRSGDILAHGIYFNENCISFGFVQGRLFDCACCPQGGQHALLRMTVKELQTFLHEEEDEVANAVGVAPLVVVPADDLHRAANDLGERRIDDRRPWIALEVA
jgi:hypothetical protein